MGNGLACRCVRFAAVVMVTMVLGCYRRQSAPQFDPTRAYIDARSALRQASEEADPQVRTKALEALAETEGRAAGAIMVQSLLDEHAPVCFAAAMAIGDCRYEPAKPRLREMVSSAAVPPKLKCALIYALHRLRDDTSTGLLGQMLQDEDKWVRATAAMVMGKMGEPSAKGPLKTLQYTDHDPVVQLQVVEALAELGDGRSAVMLEAFAKSQYMEDRIIAVQALGRLKLPRSALVLRQLLKDRKQEPAVRAAAAGSLARLGSQVSSNFVLAAAVRPEKILRAARGENAHIRPIEITSLQTIAILSLGYMHDPLTVDTLLPLLRSRRGVIRVAASRSILKLLRAYRPPARPKPRPKKTVKKEPTTKPVKIRPRLRTAGAKD